MMMDDALYHSKPVHPLSSLMLICCVIIAAATDGVAIAVASAGGGRDATIAVADGDISR